METSFQKWIELREELYHLAFIPENIRKKIPQKEATSLKTKINDFFNSQVTIAAALSNFEAALNNINEIQNDMKGPILNTIKAGLKMEVATAESDLIKKFFGRSTPMSQALPLRVLNTGKELSTPQYIYRQGMLDARGFLWKDYYRPMTFNAVLVSLLGREKYAPERRLMKTLESLGVVAGALVGYDAIANEFSKQIFAETVAVVTGVVLPEARSLILGNLEEYITNLSNLGLERVIEIDPNNSVDGYVFFPKGPIFGFGVSQFSMKQPSFLADIDNVDVSVDGMLVDKGLAINSGEKQIAQEAIGKLQNSKSENETKILAIQNKIKSLRLAELSHQVAMALKEGKKEKAQSLIDHYKALFGEFDLSGTVHRLETDIEPIEGDLLLFLEPNEGIEKLQVLTVSPADSNFPNKLTGTYKLRLTKKLKPSETLTVFIKSHTAGLKILDGSKKTVEEFQIHFNSTNWHVEQQIQVEIESTNEEFFIKHKYISSNLKYDGTQILKVQKVSSN